MSEPLARLPARALPESVRIVRGMQLTPNEMRTLSEKTGKSLTELLGGDAEDMDAAPDRIQSLIWVQLRRQGFEVEWEEVGDVVPELAEDEPDPTSAASSPTSPPSSTTTE